MEEIGLGFLFSRSQQSHDYFRMENKYEIW